MAEPRRVAIIGGTGVYQIPGMDMTERVVETPYGPVSVQVADIQPNPLVYLNRHGPNRQNPPHKINYRGNLTALKLLGVEQIIATAAVGSVNPGMPPRSLAVLDDFMDFTSGRELTFYDGGSRGHAYVEVNSPYCPALRSRLLDHAPLFGLELLPHATYVCTNGPRFETPAEIRMFAQLGGDLVGMTGVPEVTLARELGIHYASLAYSINWAAGIESKIEIVREGIDALLGRALALALHTLQLPGALDCSCLHSLHSIYPAQDGGGAYR